MEVEDRGLRVEVQQMLDTWDIEVQRRRTEAGPWSRSLVMLALLESVIEDEFVGNRTHASFAEVQGAGPEQGRCARVYLAVGKEIETERERKRDVSST